MKSKNKNFRKIFTLSLAIFIAANGVAVMHAYRFTHFDKQTKTKSKKPEVLTTSEKIQTLLLGVKNPRPYNTQKPTTVFQTIRLNSNKTIDCWLLPKLKDKREDSSAIIILFHGYGGNKSQMLDKATILGNLGYPILLVDFMGSGPSEGNSTTLGYKEGAEVKTAFEFCKKKGYKKVFLLGTSMGAVAILKAIHQYSIQPEGIILECPFGSLQQTVDARFSTMGIPSFPMASLLVFWGGIINGFNAFEHNPTAYATAVTCPTLLLYGHKDKSVSFEETEEIFDNLNSEKTLACYPYAGHENYLINYEKEWTKDLITFLSKYN